MMNDAEAVVDEFISKYSRLANLAYERGWFKKQEHYLCVVNVLNELKREL